MSHLAVRNGVAVVVVTVFATGAGAAPALACSTPRTATAGPTPTQLKRIDSTPLGAAMETQSKRIQIDIETGTPVLDGSAVTGLIANRTACDEAAKAVAAVAVQSPGQSEIKQRWLEGVRVLARSDEQLAAYYRRDAEGKESQGSLNTAITDSNYGDALTGWAFKALIGNPGPLPKRHPVH